MVCILKLEFNSLFFFYLRNAVCPKNVISNGTSGSLSSPFYPSNYPNDMECSWNITGPAGSRLILVFYRICLGACTTVSSCDCDSITVSKVFSSRQLCTGSDVFPFISLQNKISLTMLSDDKYSLKGFVADYHSVFLDGG